MLRGQQRTKELQEDIEAKRGENRDEAGGQLLRSLLAHETSPACPWGKAKRAMETPPMPGEGDRGKAFS